MASKKTKPTKVAPRDELAERRERKGLVAELAMQSGPEWEVYARQLAAGKISNEYAKQLLDASPEFYTAKMARMLGNTEVPEMPATVAAFVLEKAGKDA